MEQTTGNNEEEYWYGKNIPPIPIKPDVPIGDFSMQCWNGTSAIPVSDETYDRLLYDNVKACMDVEKHRAIKEQDLEYEEQKNRNKMICSLKKEMVSYDIFKDGYGDLIYMQVGSQEEKLHMKRLCNLLDYHCYILYTYGNRARKVLNVTWRGREDGVYFRIGTNGISTKSFCHVLKAQGVNFQISRRCEKEVIDSLISYSIINSDEIEIPDRIGWNRMSNEIPHFVKPGEIVMEEVWRNAHE